MEKNLTIDMRNVRFKGNTLDVGNDNYGIIYNILKNIEDEISVDYYIEDLENEYTNKYDNGVLFFSLSQLSNKAERDKVLKTIWKNLRFGGSLYIWDREKKQKEIVNDKIKVLMDKGKEKEFIFSNMSPFTEFTIYSTQKILEKYFEIQETRVCDKIIFVKAIKRGSIQNESVTNSNKLKVYSQQSSSEVLKGIYKGFKFPR